MPIVLKLTSAGLAALTNAESTGTDPVLLSEVGITTTAFTPTVGLTAVPAELKRVPVTGGAVVAPDVMHVLLRDDSADAYSMRGFGLYLEGGVLFGTFSDGSILNTKVAAAVMLMAIDVRFSALDAALIEFGDTDFINPPATATTAGVVELATNAETATGTDATRAVTPAGLKYVMDNSTIADATTTVKGKVELATFAEVQDGTDNVRAVTPAGLNSRTATTARTGLVELATLAEAAAGLDTDRAVTPAGLANAVPQASATAQGKVELATAAEVQTGADTERAITPAGLSARSATETRTGLVELATAAEVVTGTDTDRAVTPAGLAGRTATETRTGLVELATAVEAAAGLDSQRAVTPAGLAAAVPAASEVARGKVELATIEEAEAGTDTERAITAAGLAAAIAAAIAAIPGRSVACASIAGRVSNGNAARLQALNCSNVVRTDNGEYTITYATPLPDTNYIITLGTTGTNDVINVKPGTKSQYGFSVRIQTGQANDGSGGQDPSEFWFNCQEAPPAT